jgi:hypothetical protein
MKRHIILIVIVAALSSCDDMYNNLSDVNTDKVYPGKFDFAHPKRGINRIEIDLLEAGHIPSADVNLQKAVATVVEYGKDILVIDSVVSWVSVPGLTLPNMYQFKIYTRDEFGNASVPVFCEEKPFTDQDKAAIEITDPRVASFVSWVVVQFETQTVLFNYCSLSYSYTDKDGESAGGEIRNPQNKIIVENLPSGVVVPINISYKVLPPNVIDTLLLTTQLQAKTVSQEVWDDYLLSTQPFGVLPVVSSAAPCTIPGVEFDLGGEGVAYHDSNTNPVNSTRSVKDPNCTVACFGAPYNCIGGTAGGEWIIYSIDVQTAGDYMIDCWMANNRSQGQFHVEVDNVDVSGGSIVVPNTNNDVPTIWVPIPSATYLTTGQHKIKVGFDNAPGLNLGAVRLTYQD